MNMSIVSILINIISILSIGGEIMNVQYVVPGELSEAVSHYNEKVDINEYINSEHVDKIINIISEHAWNNYKMKQHEYVVSVLVPAVCNEKKSRVIHSYLLGGEKIGESRTLSGAIVEPYNNEAQLPYYIFDVQDLEDFKHVMIGHGPRTFRIFIDKNSLSVLSPEQVKELREK